MNYAIGDILRLKTDAIDTSTGKIMFSKQTEVEIVYIKNGKVDLKFPDNNIHQHLQSDIPLLFENTSSNKIFYNTITGLGTPPEELHKYLPKEASWKKNYIWKISVEIEERNDKEIICPECTNDLKDYVPNELGQIECENCSKKVIGLKIEDIDKLKNITP